MGGLFQPRNRCRFSPPLPPFLTGSASPFRSLLETGVVPHSWPMRVGIGRVHTLACGSRWLLHLLGIVPSRVLVAPGASSSSLSLECSISMQFTEFAYSDR